MDKKTLITIHCDAEEIHHVLERVKKDGEHHGWETLLGWSPTATGICGHVFNSVAAVLSLSNCVMPVTYDHIIHKTMESNSTPRKTLRTLFISISRDA